MTAGAEPLDNTELGPDAWAEAACGLAVMDRRGRILAANRMMRSLIGDAAATGARTFLDTLRPGDRIFWETHVAPLLDMQGEVREIAVEVAGPAGPVPILLNVRNERPGDPLGTLHVAVFPARDRRSYERELLNARRRAEESEEHARQLAETLQASLIPPSLPSIPEVDLGAAYHPAGEGAEVGGDFYDCFQVSESDWVVAIGDVCGKGARAAAVTALVRYTIRGAAIETDHLPEVLWAVNTALFLDHAPETCTAVVARVAPSPEELRVSASVAGHPLPRLVSSGGRVQPIGEHAPLLGAFRGAAHRATTVALRQGESLVFFTDGVTEARRGDEFFGDERLHAVIARHSSSGASALAHAVADAALEFQDGRASDDIAVLVVARAG